MKVAISGSSGFIGRYVSDYLTRKGHQVLGIKRAQLGNSDVLAEVIAGADVIINLAGANIARRWSSRYKDKLVQSRVGSTKALVRAMEANDEKQLLISTSAIGIYENDIFCDEEDYIYGHSFLQLLCHEWENEAQKSTKRVAIFRLGVVLGDGGALQKMKIPFKMGLGGRIGNGKQSFSFVHIKDLARAYEHIMIDEKLEGVFNLTAPKVTSNGEFSKVLAHKLHRWAFVPMPKVLMRGVLGESAKILCDGQNVYPKRLLESGFTFLYENAEETLEDLLG